MHGVRHEVLQAQARAAELPLWEVPLPWPCSNETYESQMKAVCNKAVADGVQAIAFGDLFLRDIREYREKQLAATGLRPLFPLWEIPTARLAREMIAGGLKAKLSCVDSRVLAKEFAGREFDTKLLEALPTTVDPCAENGEFHTCVYAGPMFRKALTLANGEVVERDGFVYVDLTLVKHEGPATRKGKAGIRTYSFSPRSLSELEITETELRLMAAAAMIGLSSTPKNG